MGYTESPARLFTAIFMDIAATTPLSLTLTLPTAPAISKPWQVGQRLEAIVVALLGQDRLSIRIGNALLDARSTVSVNPGQRLTLEVAQIDKQVSLRLVNDAPESEAIKAAMRTALPQQSPLQVVFTRIAESLAASTALPATTITLIKQLIQNLPTVQHLVRADTLKQALMDSGVFLEHKLSRQSPEGNLQNDTKANLLRLLSNLTPDQEGVSNSLRRDTEAALARIHLHQLAALSQEQPTSSWIGEIPVRHGKDMDALRFRVEKDGKQDGSESQPSWNTYLSLNLSSLGPLHARITLSLHNIATAFWAESESTAALINTHADFLRTSLERLGLEVSNIHCHKGTPPWPSPDSLPRGLLDISA